MSCQDPGARSGHKHAPLTHVQSTQKCTVKYRVQCRAVKCSVQCSAVQCSIQCSVQCSAVYSAAEGSLQQATCRRCSGSDSTTWIAELHYTALHRTALYYTALQCTVLHCSEDCTTHTIQRAALRNISMHHEETLCCYCIMWPFSNVSHWSPFSFSRTSDDSWQWCLRARCFTRRRFENELVR